MAGQEKRVKFVDSAMLQNDVLRPWTIDIHLEKRLQQESSALNKILQFTTPQKFAGTLASSVIDSVPEELRVFRDTLNLKYSRRLSELVPVESPALSRRSEASTRPSSSAPSSAIPRYHSYTYSCTLTLILLLLYSYILTLILLYLLLLYSYSYSYSYSFSFSSSSYSSYSYSFSYTLILLLLLLLLYSLLFPRDYDDADLEYIDRMKRSMYLKSMRIRYVLLYVLYLLLYLLIPLYLLHTGKGPQLPTPQ
jgi:hypothetical protein